jgi:hypothetical protein
MLLRVGINPSHVSFVVTRGRRYFENEHYWSARLTDDTCADSYLVAHAGTPVNRETERWEKRLRLAGLQSGNTPRPVSGHAARVKPRDLPTSRLYVPHGYGYSLRSEAHRRQGKDGEVDIGLPGLLTLLLRSEDETRAELHLASSSDDASDFARSGVRS